MVISLATSDCHSAADALTSSTVPVVMDARKVMMATTATSARPAIEARGTIRDRLRAGAGTCRGSLPPPRPLRALRSGVHQRAVLVAGSTHRYAAVSDAAPADARRTDPSA